jgi:YegS/Rv2252/BmrU family lipid kinase
MRTIVFINSHSRQARSHLKAVKKYFARKDCPFKVVDFIVVKDLEKYDRYIDRLKSNKSVECVIIGSGDGTIVSVINALKDRKDLTYGFLPLGTTNAFVRSLGLPLDYSKVLKQLYDYQAKYIHLGSINGTLFANVAGVGVSSAVVENLTNRHKRLAGIMSYFFTGFRELMRHKPIWCELQIGNETNTFNTLDLVIANGRYRGPVIVDKKLASVYKDQLVLVYSTDASRFVFIKDTLNILLGRRHKIPDVKFIPIKKALLKTRPRTPIHVDGEIIGHTPANIQIVKNAIRVLVPPEAPVQQYNLRKNRR